MTANWRWSTMKSIDDSQHQRDQAPATMAAIRFIQDS
jgi:hypothetical protein